jgi:hypothetical protein
MTSVEQLIGDLLLRHNCVIVPSFGGFVAKPVPASIDFDKGTMTPPSKSLLFNKQLINNDGLLINEFAQANAVDYVKAESEVTDLVRSWNEQLKNGSRIELDRVGILYRDSENNVCFEQDRFFNLLLESFGLGQVQFVAEEVVQKTEVKEEAKIIPIEKEIVPVAAVEEAKVEKTDEAQEEIKVVEYPVIAKKRRSGWKYVAAACLLPLAFYSFWIPMKTDVLESGVLSINDFNPFYEKTEGAYEKSDLVGTIDETEDHVSVEDEIADISSDSDMYSYKVDEGEYKYVEVPEKEIPSNDFEPEVNENISSQAMNFIVGCFGNESNAVNLVAKLKAEGFDARIVDFHNGLHRVTAGSALSIEAFAQIKVKAQGAGYVGWTLK